MRGRGNLAAVISYLLADFNMSRAQDVILSGGSAGGTAVFLALDWVRALLPPSIRLWGAPDAGFFIDAPQYDAPATHAFRASFLAGDAIWNTTGSGGVNAACATAFASEKWRCFFPGAAWSSGSGTGGASFGLGGAVMMSPEHQ